MKGDMRMYSMICYTLSLKSAWSALGLSSRKICSCPLHLLLLWPMATVVLVAPLWCILRASLWKQYSCLLIWSFLLVCNFFWMATRDATSGFTKSTHTPRAIIRSVLHFIELEWVIWYKIQMIRLNCRRYRVGNVLVPGDQRWSPRTGRVTIKTLGVTRLL